MTFTGKFSSPACHLLVQDKAMNSEVVLTIFSTALTSTVDTVPPHSTPPHRWRPQLACTRRESLQQTRHFCSSPISKGEKLHDHRRRTAKGIPCSHECHGRVAMNLEWNRRFPWHQWAYLSSDGWRGGARKNCVERRKWRSRCLFVL